MNDSRLPSARSRFRHRLNKKACKCAVTVLTEQKVSIRERAFKPHAYPFASVDDGLYDRVGNFVHRRFNRTPIVHGSRERGPNRVQRVTHRPYQQNARLPLPSFNVKPPIGVNRNLCPRLIGDIIASLEEK